MDNCIKDVRLQARVNLCCDDGDETGNIKELMMAVSLIDVQTTTSYLHIFTRAS